MVETNFEAYISLLREKLLNLSEYRERTGTSCPTVTQVRDDLFDADPFVVFQASLKASVLLTDKRLYH